MIEQSGMLVDMNGNPIPEAGDRARAQEELLNFMEKEKSKFEAFWKEYGYFTRPPIKYHTGNKQWIWME